MPGWMIKSMPGSRMIKSMPGWMIKSKPGALPSCCASTHSLMAIVAYTVEVTLLATPPAVSSGKSATLRLPLSIINGGVLQIHAAELPRGRACPVCSQLNRAGQRGGSGSSVPRPAVCVRASSHTSSNSGKKEVSTTTTQKAMRGPWTCGDPRFKKPQCKEKDIRFSVNSRLRRR